MIIFSHSFDMEKSYRKKGETMSDLFCILIIIFQIASLIFLYAKINILKGMVYTSYQCLILE